MKEQFVELTPIDASKYPKVLVNVNHILTVMPLPNGSYIIFSNNTDIRVSESYECLMSMIYGADVKLIKSKPINKIKQLINDSNKAFSEFVPTIKLDEYFTYNSLLDRFKNFAPDTYNDKINGELHINTFIRWINKYCQLNGFITKDKQNNGKTREYKLIKNQSNENN